MSHTCPVPTNKDSNALTITKSANSDDTKIAMCATLELDNCRAENYQLKKKLIEYEATIRSLEQLVSTIAEKQHQILSEVVELRKESRAASLENTVQEEDTLGGDSSGTLQDDDVADEDGYSPDSESEANDTQSPALSANSSLASLASLCFSSTSSLATSLADASSDSEYEPNLFNALDLSDQSEDNAEADSLSITPDPEISPLQDYSSESEGEP
ncbi:uncharacterized protein LOC108024911 isoform X2 [Drosophila biarmipes]|uniref:uncharacterized protein LOC108024911 isoform X2 n=1 Tax=Drosophila biarmipes TaxID=125945 RepID=UPI0007E77D9F|nr:uncharacterized protein LOC108024911 isoform X2 [Drosophila biarmipes]